MFTWSTWRACLKVLFASNCFQLPMLSFWQQHAKSQSRILLSSGNGLLHSISGCFDKPNCLFGNKASYISIHGTWLCPLDSNLYWLLPKKNQETIQHPGKLTSDFPNKVCRKFACLLEPTSNAVACNVTTCDIILQLLT